MNHESHGPGCHLSEHPAMLWRGAVRRAHKDPVFPQRRQRQTHCRGAFFFFFLTAFFPNSNYYHTRATWWIVTCHQGIRRAAWKYDIIRISDDCAWPGCYFVKYFLFLSSFHTWLPFSHSELAWCEIFHVRGWKIFFLICIHVDWTVFLILLICPLASSALAQSS